MNGSHDRDRAFERLLRRTLAPRSRGGAMDGCLDAETMAAWMDGGLSEAERNRAQVHLADCAHCQAVMGALVRTDATTPPAAEAAPRRWLGWWAPALAVAAAIVLWVAVPRDSRVPLPPASRVAALPSETRGQSGGEPTDQKGTTFATARAAQPPERLDASNAEGPKAPAAKEEQRTRADLKDSRRPEALASAAAPTGDVAADNHAREPTTERRGEIPRLEADRAKPASSGIVGGLAGAVPPSSAPRAEKAVGSIRPAAPSAALGQTAAAGIEIASPDPVVRWRISASTVQRTTDGGAHWETSATGTLAELTAGSAPSATLCWLVGRGGVVLLSTDGRSWRRVTFPEMTDLSSVQATDARAASVTTTDGRIFSTADGGVSWRR